MGCEGCTSELCTVRGKTLPKAMFSVCQRGGGSNVDAMLQRVEQAKATATPFQRQQAVARVRTRHGDRLAAIIERETGEHIDCKECDSEVGRLNWMSADAICNEIETLADGIIKRGETKARHWHERWACKHAPAIVKRYVREWINEAITPVPELDTSKWTSDIRHLTFHVWPTKRHDSWRWNIRQLAKRWSMFNGIKCIGIVTDRDSETAQTVLDYSASLGMVWDHVVKKGNARSLREVYTWVPMIERLAPEHAGANEVVFACHGKGVRHSTQEVQIMRWAEVMYASCLDDWPRVEEMLREFISVGSFKRYGTFAGGTNHRWDYSGTFFWWRLAEIGKKNWRQVDQRFFGTESWLGKHIKSEQAGCLFHDNTGDLYCAEQWRTIVWPAWIKYLNEMAERHAQRSV